MWRLRMWRNRYRVSFVSIRITLTNFIKYHVKYKVSVTSKSFNRRKSNFLNVDYERFDVLGGDQSFVI